jgi:ubiquinone/menaquinone biosynthesis C-methylase UbiE
MDREQVKTLQTGYDTVAEEYAERLFDELENKPLDGELLDRFAANVRGKGLVCDMGCGPGQVARFLRNLDLKVCGVDLSQGMVEQAKRLNPEIDFLQGDMFALDIADETFAGIAAFYSIVNLPRQEVTKALRELQRILKPNGLLLLAFHLGDEALHVEELWEKPVSLDFYFFTSAEVTGYLQAAAFVVEEVIERPPYAPDVEHQSHRAYIFARKTGQ